ncbi:TIGR00288 family NYN domain-containing protein [Candidatus Micrarchaeota archaeon]|nr:TIGR00288 family NYN domain-containing protein [Candidatus Micrarchaeota archaeon]
MVLERVKKKLSMEKRPKKKRIGLLVDGPNMLRHELGTDLREVRRALEEHGTIKFGGVFLDQHAPEKLIEAVANQGFQPMLVITDDVDAPMAAEAMELIFNKHIDTIALMTRDSDFQSVLLKAKKYGKETIVVGAEPFSTSLRNTADHVIIVGKKG